MAATSGFLDSISPWTSRSATPKQNEVPSPGLGQQQQGGDHRVSHFHPLSQRAYPVDCPPLNVRWYYAVDVPKRKPKLLSRLEDKPKLFGQPKKYAPFSARDSRSIEAAFQKLLEEHEQVDPPTNQSGEVSDSVRKIGKSSGMLSISHSNSSLDESAGQGPKESVKVPVNEDYLFDVDIDARELAPAYWLGPIYEVRRASWFYQEGASTRPCDENLATQLEEGYLKTKPWRNEMPPPIRTASQSRKRPSSWLPTEDVGKNSSRTGRHPSVDDTEKRRRESPAISEVPNPKLELQTHRLFGTYMNSVVTYQDATVAWLLTDDFLSRMSSTVYQRLAGGGHLGGVKLVRGYTELGKAKEIKSDGNVSPHPNADEPRGRSNSTPNIKSSAPSGRIDSRLATGEPYEPNTPETSEPESKTRRKHLEKWMASFVENTGEDDPAIQEEEVRKRQEEEIRDDYKDSDGDKQDREIEHLVLVTHGIGQSLGLKLESLNFIHDVNVLRKTLKSIYETSPDLQSLNSEMEKLPKNCRIQVLPIVWRPQLDFPKRRFKDGHQEKDLSDADSFADEMAYPSVNDIRVEGVMSIRNLIEDLFLDILLYQSGYREHIAKIVQQECNRVYHLFCLRNPNFKGKISLIGHSLGSAIFFDLLCHQKDEESTRNERPGRHRLQKPTGAKPLDPARDYNLDFEVEDLYCLGSPIGIFQMLKGKKISGRRALELSQLARHDSFFGFPGSTTMPSPAELLEANTASSPKCNQLYNIFHPTDPVAYRIEPLISPAMRDLKPQPLPYVKKGIFTVPAQGLSGIGVRVGQSVSDLWSNITTGVASSLLNRSLGLTADPQPGTSQTRQSIALGSEINETGEKAGSATPSNSNDSSDTADLVQVALEHPPTLIDSEIETLYSGFRRQQHTKTAAMEEDGEHELQQNSDLKEAEDRARQYRREEAKVRALNSNGRVDYSIQEGVFDISLIGSIASHLSYWSDEDVNHFIVSQLLSRQRIVKRPLTARSDSASKSASMGK